MDRLDAKLTSVSAASRMLGGKDVHGVKRASYISGALTQVNTLKKMLTQDIQYVSPDQLNLIKQTNKELEKVTNNLDKAKSEQTLTDKQIEKSKVTLNSLRYSLKKANLQVEESTNKWLVFSSTLVRSVRKISAFIYASKQVINVMLDLYKYAADYAETMNLFNVATQDSSESLMNLATNMSKAYNTDIQPILNSIAVFRQYANTMNIASREADTFATGLTKITADLSSLYNTDYTTMFNALKSGIAGQTKPLMRYGISVHSATLEQTAMEIGLNRNVTSLNESEKVLLRYVSIIRQATSAQGDLAKTIESPANQLKIAGDQTKVLLRNLGSLVVLVSQNILPVFNGFIITINKLLSTLAKAAGYKTEDYTRNLSSANSLLEDGAEDAEEYADALKGTLAPLDEINQQTNNKQSDSLGLMDPKITAALEDYDNLMEKINSKADKISDALTKIINPKIFESVGNLLSPIVTSLSTILTVATNALNIVAPVIGIVTDALSSMLLVISKIATLLNPALEFIGALTSNIWLLIGAFAALNAAQYALYGNTQKLIAVKLAKWISSNTVAIWNNVKALVAQAAEMVKTLALSIQQKIANWLETASWWQKFFAMSAVLGVAGVVAAGIAIASATAVKNAVTNETSNIPGAATGGVVNSPTLAMVGEGKYKEAIVPLENSPQFSMMKSDIANEVIRKIGPTPYRSVQPFAGDTPVILNIDGREFARIILPYLGKVQNQTGVTLAV